jgi:hypothetical protein
VLVAAKVPLGVCYRSSAVRVGSTNEATLREVSMAVPRRIPTEPPGWALDQATQEVDEDESIPARAWELVREKQRRYDERHDEYDDPDQGGEG